MSIGKVVMNNLMISWLLEFDFNFRLTVHLNEIRINSTVNDTFQSVQPFFDLMSEILTTDENGETNV